MRVSSGDGQLRSATQSDTTAQLGHCRARAAVNNTQTNERGSVPGKRSVWSLKFEFYIIFTCHKIFC